MTLKSLRLHCLPAVADIKTDGLSERVHNMDFDRRSQLVQPPLVKLHRLEYFQRQISLQRDTEQDVARTVRPFKRGDALALDMTRRDLQRGMIDHKKTVGDWQEF